jgi:hypothetical protein
MKSAAGRPSLPVGLALVQPDQLGRIEGSPRDRSAGRLRLSEPENTA